MKILCIDQTGQMGGGEIALLPWLKASADDVTMVLFEDGPFRAMVESLGRPVHVLTSMGLKKVRRESGWRVMAGMLPSLWRLRRDVARLASGFDLVYANSQKAFLVAALAKRRGQPLVWHLRDILTAEHFSPLMRRVAVGFGNRFATQILANSKATAEAWVAAGGDRSKIVVVYDGVSSIPFDEVEAATVAALRSGFGGGAPVVGLFGRLSPWKGQHVLLEAVASIPGVHAILVGDALFGEGVYAARLKERARLPDLAGRVHFMGFRSDVAALMKSVDVVVHTSTSPEPFGLVIVEGMLARKPVIATRAGGAIEILEDATQGLLVEPGSVAELRQAIETLIREPGQCQSMAEFGRARAEGAFSERASVEGITNALHRCR